jgi:hypothetical protein
VRHHPRWWRKRYEAEVLALVESDRPGAPAVADLARSCARTWFECQLPSSEWGGPAWLVALRLLIQLPLVLATMLVTFAFVLSVVVSVFEGRAGALGLWGMTAGPIAASGAVAIYAGLIDRRGQRPVRVTLACVAAALLAMVAALAGVAIHEPDRVGPLNLLRLPVAYAAAVGLIVRMAFRGLPWKRCVINCVHHRAGDDAALTS